MILTPAIIREFNNVTRYPLIEYLTRYATFIRTYRQNIFQYYSGNLSKVPEVAFNELRILLSESSHISNLIDLHHDRMRSGLYWELLELLSTIQISLETIDNSSKWLRSAITKNNFTPNPESLYVIKRLQTLEKISDRILGSSNPERDWVRLALRNDLEEEEYTSNGGNSIYISTQGKYTLKLRTVVDNITEEKVYGMDIDRKITFFDDDLKNLTYKETFLQTIDILSTLKQGDSPEFPSEGIQASLIQGTNIASIPYQIIFRQLQNTFSQDDTIRSLAVTDIQTREDALFYSINIESRLGEVESRSINMSQL